MEEACRLQTSCFDFRDFCRLRLAWVQSGLGREVATDRGSRTARATPSINLGSSRTPCRPSGAGGTEGRHTQTRKQPSVSG